MSNEERKELKEELLDETFMWNQFGQMSGYIKAPHAELVALKEEIENGSFAALIQVGSDDELVEWKIEGDTFEFEATYRDWSAEWLKELSKENPHWNIRCDVFLHEGGYSLHRLENGVWFDYDFPTKEDEDGFTVIAGQYYPWWKKSAPKIAVEIAENIGLDGEYWEAMCLEIDEEDDF